MYPMCAERARIRRLEPVSGNMPGIVAPPIPLLLPPTMRQAPQGIPREPAVLIRQRSSHLDQPSE
jgi:hypothetical protein